MRRTLRITCLALVALASTIFGTVPADAADEWRVVVRVKGDVDSREPGQTDWQPIFRSRRLNDGGMAKTGPDGVANINLADQSTFRIGPASEVTMTKFQLTPEGRTVVFQMRVGKVQASVARFFGKQSQFQVTTPNGVLAARGTEFAVTVLKESELRQLQGLPSKPQAAAGNAGELLAQNDPEVTLVSVTEGTVVGKMKDKKETFFFHPGDNAIFGFGGVQINPANFPVNQMIPPTRPAPDPAALHTQYQSADFQDPAHRAAVDSQTNRQMGQYTQFNGFDMAQYSVYSNAQYYNQTQANSNTAGGNTTASSPPFFNPVSTQDPIPPSSQSNFTLVPGSGQPNGLPTNPTTPVAPPTGRLILIIR